MKTLSRAAVFIAAANAILVALLSTYDVRLGPIHLAASGLFKPLLYVSAAVLLVTLAPSKAEARWKSSSTNWTANWTTHWVTNLNLWALLIAVVTIAIYVPSFFVDFSNNDWKHNYTSAEITSLGSLARLFVIRRPDGFYRPLTFFSLWIDYSIFHAHVWGYHLQNIALHIVNAILVAKLGRRLGLDATAANFGALLFATAAVNYEPVMWPGARFDLLAALFTLGALLAYVRYVNQPSTVDASLGWTLALFVAGLMSKESAYCVPLVVAFLMVTRDTWKLPPISLSRRALVLAGLGAIVIAFVAIRFVIYGGLGGYPDATGQSPHFELRLTTLTSFFTRALPVPLFAPNASIPLPAWALIAVVGFAIWACFYALICGGALRRNAGLLACALLSAAPEANLVNWIGPMMHNTRYLYLMSLWIFLLIAAAAGSSVWARPCLAALVLVNSIGVLHNIASYHWIDPGERPVARIQRLDTKHPAPRDRLARFHNYRRPPLADARGSESVLLSRDREGAVYTNCESALAPIRYETLRDAPQSDCRSCPSP